MLCAVGLEMGEAKRRGTYDERKESAVAAAEQHREEQDQLRREREALMTPEERSRRVKARTTLVVMTAIAAGFLGA